MVNIVGTYISQCKTRRRRAAEEERLERLEKAQRHPEIIDPSYELFGYRAPLSTLSTQDPFKFEAGRLLNTSESDDWHFQTRRARTMPEAYQFEPFCEVTPKSSVTSTDSATRSSVGQQRCDMKWGSGPLYQPRPQSVLPANKSADVTDLSCPLSTQGNQSRRHSSHIAKLQQKHAIALNTSGGEIVQLGATLSSPFSLQQPVEMYLSDSLCLTPIEPTKEVLDSIAEEIAKPASRSHVANQHIQEDVAAKDIEPSSGDLSPGAKSRDSWRR